MKQMPDVAVVGTDTGVGKSVVSLLLMQLLLSKGFTPFYLKPFQTGCVDAYDLDSDAAFVYAHTAHLKGRDPAQSVIYCHPNPKAPFFASRDVGQSVDMDRVLQKISLKRSSHCPLIVEAAGGLLVPVTDDLLVADILSMMRCRPLLVAKAGLGTINHTLLSIEALKKRGIQLMGAVFVESGGSTTSAGMVAENMEAVEKFGGIRVGGVIAHVSDFSAPPDAAYRPLEKVVFGK